ncbi:MAG TPA: GNAT family N-acetyltransferase [Xanthomonadaceae bacterium]|nr:GNAT family N-acetyltransferase [Xanthomonadaceae bacterium]
MPTIRDATVDDAPEIARLSAQLGYPAEAAVFAERLRRLLPLPTHAVLVCEHEGGGLDGFVGLEHRLMIEAGERVEIVGLVVDARARRGGVGRALIAAAEAWTRARGLDALFLRSNVLRPEAHPFYESLGFLRTKTQHAYLKRV